MGHEMIEKSTWNKIRLALAIPPVAMLILFACVMAFAPRTPADPQWPKLTVQQVQSVSLSPRLDYSYQTISGSALVTNATSLTHWFAAVSKATPFEDWPGTAINRDRGPRGLMLSFSATNGTTAVFEVWMCDKNQAASCKEDLVTTEYVET